ncbi:murein biosynthesis integral membrane protein MurJ [Candidatus Pantoea edessiphila]|uniref:Probable lipid II flippase MurJ n=1 Tax=Candidatus Pantoea edessiphila TaxID=2044610 RepID=A0A2P5T2G9_9GAMM|nr:murein biosynthesis integral membrane protein MurJ [Candidatus Pantoea edessiphila]PPI88768.1 murein biosynthesis integral membrane protein MurJ [Candidatus Pantoea edessiphila]
MNLLKSLTTVSGVTILSRILGFTRDVIIAQYFGAGMFTDAFFTAYKLPNLLRRVFAEGAFSQAFIPVFIEYKSKKDNESVRLFISYISGILTLILMLFLIIGIIFAPKLIAITAPGFIKDDNIFYATVHLSQVMFPYILLISLASLVGVILNTFNYFLVPAFTPVLFNISIIIFALLSKFYFSCKIILLGWGVLIGGLLQLCFQLPSLRKIKLLVIPNVVFNNAYVLLVISRMGPAIISMSVSQISSLINNVFSSFLPYGSISWLYFSNRIIEFPAGVLGVALSTIILPYLSKSLTKGDYKEYSRSINWGLRICFLLSLPSTVGLIILSKPIITVLFQYGKFKSHDTLMTQQALICYSLGLVSLIAIKVLVLGFYSNNDMKTPVKISIFSLIITQLINLLFFSLLKYLCLSLSISIAAILNAFLLYYNLRKKHIFKLQEGWNKFLIHIGIATSVMGVVLLIMLQFITKWGEGLIIIRIFKLSLICSIGVIVYFYVLKIFGFQLENFSYQSKS